MFENNVSTLLLENYDSFVREHNDLFEEALSAVSTITDDSYYEMYIDKLMEGLDESTVRRLRPVLDREREMYIEEASSILTSPQAIAYAVASFPMLINIYADPMLSKVVTVYPYDKPTMTIPRLRWVAKVIDEAGHTQEYLFPTATDMIRPQYKNIDVPQAGNLFDIMAVQKGDFRISQRNFRIASINVTDGGGNTLDVDVNAQADARGNIMHGDIQIGQGVYKLQAQVDFESGSVTWSLVTIVADPNGPVTANTAKCRFRFFGNGNGRQVVKSAPRQDIIDINADIEDSFEDENIEEVIQDWKALYNINILAELKNHVKDQIKLNRDFEIADLLEANMTFADTIGQLVTVDLSSFVGSDKVRPTTIQDIFKNVVPPINALIERMRRQNNMEVKYLVCGIDVSAILKSLQEFAIRMEGLQGEAGFTGSVGAFAKLEIVASYAVRPDLLHLIIEAPTLPQSSIAMIMYKPLYIITETTNSIRRTFIKSRTWIGIVRPEGIGTVVLDGYENYFGAFNASYTPGGALP
jgi:hypothetical protein